MEQPARGVTFSSHVPAHRHTRFAAPPSSPGPGGGVGPRWAYWNTSVEPLYTIGIEEELMLLRRPDHSLAQSSETVLRRLSRALRAHSSPETHASVIELSTGIHADVAGAASELAALRSQLARELASIGLSAASADTYPLVDREETKVSHTARYGRVLAVLPRTRHRFRVGPHGDFKRFPAPGQPGHLTATPTT